MDPLKLFKNSPIHERLTAYVLVHYRWIFVLIFLLPLSVLFSIYSYVRNKIVFYLRSAPRNHDLRVKNVQAQIRNWKKSNSSKRLCTARPGWQTMSFRVGKYKSTNHPIKINLIDVLQIDTTNRFVKVEPMVSMGQLTSTLLPLGWTIPIVPELDDLTVGGLLMGTGVETSSHKYGLFQDICLSMELVLCDGSLVTCSKTENSDLFYAAFWSYGTLGFLVSAEIKIIPASQYVQINYYPCHSMKQLMNVFQTEVMKSENNDFVECLVYSAESGVVMTANMTDEIKSLKVNNIGRFYKPWFFKHVEKKLKHSDDKSEIIPLRDYYHRHSKSIFWELQDIIPFGNSSWFRFTLGWAVPPKISLLKLTQTAVVKKMYEETQIIQDMLIPLRCLSQALTVFNDEVNVYPLWLCPFMLNDNPGFLRPKFDTFDKFQGKKAVNYVMYVDIGAYGVPKSQNYHARNTTRRIEEFVRKCGGFQMLYADTYMTREEFHQMFDHTLYEKVRYLYDCHTAFPEIYDKISKSARI